jgi:hypothetical protein
MNLKLTTMKLIKNEDEKRRDYLFQNDKKTRYGATFVSTVLVLLTIAVVSTYFTLR